MRTFNVSASRLPIAFKCLASAVLPHTEFETSDSNAGRERHGNYERAIVEDRRDDIPEGVAALLEGYELHAEVAFAYDVSDGEARVIGVGIDRAYPDPRPFDIQGTTDVYAIGDGLIPTVADWKGPGPSVEHPSENKQTMHAALCVARITKAPEIRVIIAHEGRPPMVAVLDTFELEIYASQLRDLQREAINAARVPIEYEVEGAHCRYCPAYNACSKKKTLLALVKSDEATKNMEMLLPLENDEAAREAYVLAQRLAQLQKRVWAALYARGASRPIPLGGGKVWGKVIADGNEQLDADITYAILREELGQEAADVGVKRETSKAAVERAIKAAGKKPISKKQEEILVMIRAKNGIKRPTTETWCEHTPPARPQLKVVGE